MARHIKTKKQDRIEIGGGVTILVTRSRGGELGLLVTAPADTPIQHFKAAAAPNEGPESPTDTPFGALPSQFM